MNHAVILRTSVAIATLSVLQAVLPAVILGASLASIAYFRDVPLDRLYITLAILAMVLTATLLRPASTGSPVLQLRLGSFVMDVLLRWGIIVAILLALGFAAGLSDHFARSVVLPWAVIAPALMVLVLWQLRTVMRRVVLSPENLRTAIIVGVNTPSLALGDRLAKHPELCTRLLGFFDDRSAERLGSLNGFTLEGKLSDVAAYVERFRVDVIFIALPLRHLQRVMDLVDELRDSTASIYYVPDVFVFDLIQSRTTEIIDVPVIAMCETPFYGYRGVMKRVTDIGLTMALMTVALPIMLVIALLVRMDSRGPIIFRQRRYGLDGKEIVVYKFRSMFVTEDGAHVQQATRGDPRVTRVGRVLRRYSLDELPQLINVLQGRMSLVGPRPHAVAHNEQYRRLIKSYMVRHKVLPGITGLAQVNGCRGETTELKQMEARVKYDLEYLRSWTPLLDVKLLGATLMQVLRDSKAY
jgi:putative colanic acid biosynthesis UDP-glucose lipid carrier transferase